MLFGERVLTLFGEGVPALGGEGDFFAVASDEEFAVLGLGDVSDDIDIVNGDEFLVVGERAGEEQFVVLSAVEGAGNDVQVHLLGERGCLIING